jgi:hypothetical protein
MTMGAMKDIYGMGPDAPLEVAGEFERICRDMIGSVRILEYENIEHGGRKYEIRPEPELDRRAAIEMRMSYSLEEIQAFLAYGNALLRLKGMELRKYRSPIQNLIHSFKRAALAIGGICSEWCRWEQNFDKTDERMVQTEPARVFRILQILDLAEKMIKEARGDWPKT